jgi:hypothetical protein
MANSAYNSGMKHFLQASTLLVLSLAVTAMVANADVPSPLTLNITCGDVNATALPFQNGHCTEGMVTFRGSSFPSTVYLKVLSYPAGVLIDSGAYDTTNNGELTFTQTLVPAGSYSVVVSSDEAGDSVLTSMMVSVDSL